jgi:branched-chain amino acid transport system permease protein
MVLIGGSGTLVGPILGAAVVLLIERVLPSQLPAQMVLGIVFVGFVVFARQGIVGAVRRVAGA